MLFAGIQLAGQLMDMQMGFGLVNVIDQSGNSGSVNRQFNYLVAIIIFLSINGHHYLLQALSNSYQMMQILGQLQWTILEYLMQLVLICL